MDLDWNARLRRAAVTLRRHFGVSDPDLVADALAEYWYAVARKGRPACYNQLRWALLRAQARLPFPGTGTGQGHKDAFKFARRSSFEIVAGRRFLAPVRDASIREEMAFVRSLVNGPGEAVAFRALLLEQSDQEAYRETGVNPETLRRARRRLSRRARALRGQGQ